jgi:type IV pilus assembly protein PilB
VAGPHSPWRPLGELLVDRGLIVADELQAALAEQQRSGRKLGEILVAQSSITGSQLARILAEQVGLSLERESAALEEAEERETAVDPLAPAWRPLGQVLLARGALSEAELEDALQVQHVTGRRLGEIVVQRGYVTTQELVAAVIDQHGLEGETASNLVAATPQSTLSDELYQVEDHGLAKPKLVFRSEGMLDAIDFAFEYLEAERPTRLRVFRVCGKKREEVWAYDEQAAEEVAEPQDLISVYGFDVVHWRGPRS